MLPNVPQYVVAFFGALKAGAIVVSTSPLYTQHELEHQLQDSGATVIITLDQFFPRVQRALPATNIRTVIVTGIGEALPRRLRPIYALKSRRTGAHRIPRGGVVYRFEDLMEHTAAAALPITSPDDVAVLQYTGGTTGTAKGAMLTHRNLVANALQAYHWQGTDRERPAAMLCAAPFFHVYGLSVGMNLCVAAGATMVLVPRFVPAEVARAVQKYRPQYFPGVPTMYLALCNLKSFSSKQFGSLEICISGASALPEEVQRRFEAVSGARVVEGYGLTEASPVTHCNPVHGDNLAGTVGIPFPDTDARITDPDTWEPLPPGSIGEITVRGPQVMKGYWDRPEETEHVLRDGWLHTGDLGTMDDDGYLRVVDRIKDVIIAGGYNVYPREVEEVLQAHPKVKEAAVIGVPNAYRGETVKAVIVPREGVDVSAKEVIEYCKRELAVYKVPKMVELRSELPKTLIGKVLRRQLRDEGIGEIDAGQEEKRPVA
jgi:long-chain acyl-CoA synthetase